MPGVFIHLTEPAYAVYKGLVAQKAASKTISRLLMQHSIDLQEQRIRNREIIQDAKKLIGGGKE